MKAFTFWLACCLFLRFKFMGSACFEHAIVVRRSYDFWRWEHRAILILWPKFRAFHLSTHFTSTDLPIMLRSSESREDKPVPLLTLGNEWQMDLPKIYMMHIFTKMKYRIEGHEKAAFRGCSSLETEFFVWTETLNSTNSNGFRPAARQNYGELPNCSKKS